MWEFVEKYLEISLDVATAVSIVGAAAAFILQQRSQKQADREDAKWGFFRELADKLAEFKNQIVQEVLLVNRSLMNLDGSTEERNEKLTSVKSVARTALSSAYYYVNYDLRLKAEAIARHYDDRDLEDIPDKIESVLESMTDVIKRINHSEYVTHDCVSTPIEVYYEEHLLRDIGFRMQGDPPDFEQPYGEELDEIGKEYQKHDGYTPRRYMNKEDQPAVAFEVLDGFFQSMLSKR